MKKPPNGIEIRFDLHPAQMQVFNDPRRYIVLIAGRRFGKSYLATADAVCAALDPNNVKRKPVLLVAPTQPQAKLLYWRPLIDKLQPLITHMNSNEGLLTLNNGVMIAVKGADAPDSLRGPGWWKVILDEYASMKPYVWGEIIRPALGDVKGRALFIGTPAGRNHFYELRRQALTSPEEWGVHEFTTMDNPFLPSDEVDAMRRTMSVQEFNQEVMASFETGGGGKFKREWFRYDSQEPAEGGYLVTVDLAGFTDEQKISRSRQKMLDEHAIVTTKIVPHKAEPLDNWWVKDVQVGRWGPKECAVRIVDTVLDVKPVAWGMERGALMNAVVPYIRDEFRRRDRVPIEPQPLTHQNKIKAERIRWALEPRFEHGKITFNEGAWNRLAEDQLVHFPSDKVHDDIPDAMAYTAQLALGKTFFDFSDLDDTSYWAPVDAEVGI